MRADVRVFLACCALGFAAVARPSAAETLSALALSRAQQQAIARAFAPELVFHPLEEFFPLNSLDSLEGAKDAAPGVEAWRTRLARYRALTLDEKLHRAALGYRVFSRVRGGHAEVVVEYWCYYVYNAFTVRGGWMPFGVSDDHPHDLERLYIVLRIARPDVWSDGEPDEVWARASFRIQRVIANAHDGTIPPNEYTVADDETLVPPLTILIELGSHAMAPDLDNDGRFTPGIDSTAIMKIQWGIRDTGSTWARYRPSFMDDRDHSAIRLCGPASAGVSRPCRRYDLYSADDVQRWFAGIDLSARERRDIVGRTPWLIRTFGDTRVEKLMVPTDPPDGRMLDKMLNRRTRTEAGFVAGLTSVAHSPAILVGRRYFWDVASPHMPDLAAEANAIFPTGASRTFEASLWSSFTVDAITNVIAGVGWFSRGVSTDVMFGTDLRIGRFHVRPTWGVRRHDFDSRFTTTF